MDAIDMRLPLCPIFWALMWNCAGNLAVETRVRLPTNSQSSLELFQTRIVKKIFGGGAKGEGQTGAVCHMPSELKPCFDRMPC